jgi:hypothetical protein
MKNVELSLPGAQNSVMTAIIYFSEMLVASLLAILLLAISHIRMNLDAVLMAAFVPIVLSQGSQPPRIIPIGNRCRKMNKYVGATPNITIGCRYRR